MERFQHGDLTIAYERDGAGPSILFLHNGGTSRRIWRHQTQALAGAYEVLAVDLPGFGDSPLGPKPLTLDDYVAAVTALVDELDLAPVTIVGNCMGSNIATAIAEAHPEMVRKLVLVNPLTEATFDGGWIGILHTMEHFAPPLAKGLRGVARRIRVPRFVARTVVRFQLGPAGVKKGLQNDPELIACNLRADQLPALTDVLDDISAYGHLDRGRDLHSIPVLTIWGERNRVLSMKQGEKLNRSLRPDEHVVLSECGHLPMLEDPETVTGAIERFLAATSGPRAKRSTADR